MYKLNKYWRNISLVYFIGVFLFFVVYKGQPFTSVFLPYILFVLVTCLLFIGNTIGYVGMLIQQLTKNDKLAFSFYRAAYPLRPTNVSVLGSYGLLLLKDYQYNKAKKIFQSALKYNSYFLTEKMLRVNVTLCDWKLGHVEDALHAYEVILKDFDESFVNDGDYTTIGYLYMLAGQLEQSEAYSKKSLEKNPNYASAYDNLGQLYLKKENIEKAKENFEKALEINPNLADSNFFLGVVYEELGDKEEAKEYYNKTLECTINGLCTISKEQVEKAIDCL